MKIILLFSILFSCNWASAQWIQQSTGVNVFLRDIEFVDQNTGWSVGDGGTILRTTNGGQNWQVMPNPSGGKPLFSISPINSNIAYVAGWFETILKTTNGGQNWIIIRNGPAGTGDSYTGIHFINENTGWICGDGQKILRTTNGGQKLDSFYYFEGYFHKIYFANNSTGIATTDGAVHKTTNGGVNWFQTNLNNGGTLSQFRGLSVVNNQYCWVVGNDNRVFRSSDFGSNWNFLDTINEADQSRGIFFINQSTGWSGGTLNRLFKSTDGGITWIREETYTPVGGITEIDFVNDTIGWTAGSLGKILYTTTGGQSVVGINQISNTLPKQYELYQNYPNPFNPTTKIRFDIREKSNVKLTVFDILGRESGILVHEILSPGGYEFNFNGTGLPSGVYYYRLEAGEYRESKRMVLVK